MVLLPALVLGPEVKGTRVLQVRGKHDGLVAGLAGKLDAEVPGIEGDEDEIEVLGRQVLRGKRVKSGDGVSEGAGISDMLPRQRREARCR